MIKNKIKFIFFILFLFSNPMYLNSATVTCTFLSETSNRIINEIEGINRVLFDITSKPPGTIEWE